MTSQKSSILLLTAAAIWGLAFVAQRIGMEFIGPFTYNGIRFALGAVSLLPLIAYYDKNNKKQSSLNQDWKTTIKPGLIVGIVLFIAASLQQIGLIYTEAGKAAFVTGLYMVFVPIAGFLCFKQRISKVSVLGSITAAVGLYFLSVKSGFTIGYGDLLELIGALFWTAHILFIDSFVKKVDLLRLAFSQFVVCSVLSIVVALLFETISMSGIAQSLIPILYGGIASVGVAYTLQLIGQKYLPPAHSAIILSMETLFAAIGGYFILQERLTGLELFGCVLMFSGMLLSQVSRATDVKL